MGSSVDYKRPNHGIFPFLPDTWVPYAELMRLDRQAGFWAFYWHYLIGLGFAVNLEPFSSNIDTKTLVLLAAYLWLWTTIFRGITCTWNDNLDQDFDRQVARCRVRPIPRGAVTTVQAHLFVAVQVVAGALILSPLPTSVFTHALLDGVLLFIYPLLKRCTDFPQVELGFALSYAIFMVAAMVGKDPLAPLFDPTLDLSSSMSKLAQSPQFLSATHLYAAGILWSVIFDTIYAHQDYEDDLKAGVMGLAVRLGRNGTKPALSIAAAVQIYCLVAAGQYGGFGPAYYAISCAGTALVLGEMLWSAKLEDGKSCAWCFGPGSARVGAAIVIGLFADFWIKSRGY
ncbi:4-hydroxybenzoate polyprenyl transferase [Poronia punctata]|nr:4-hydroxybenzoate polyprenyl transferase [Poronia punctata]